MAGSAIDVIALPAALKVRLGDGERKHIGKLAVDATGIKKFIGSQVTPCNCPGNHGTLGTAIGKQGTGRKRVVSGFRMHIQAATLNKTQAEESQT
jgi:hypothetical protein